jgi:hypothetical protein
MLKNLRARLLIIIVTSCILGTLLIFSVPTPKAHASSCSVSLQGGTSVFDSQGSYLGRLSVVVSYSCNEVWGTFYAKDNVLAQSINAVYIEPTNIYGWKEAGPFSWPSFQDTYNDTPAYVNPNFADFYAAVQITDYYGQQIFATTPNVCGLC